MPFNSMTPEELAISLGVDYHAVKEKHRLIQQIRKTRKEMGLSQKDMAKKLGITQGRVAQIESGISPSKITFETLFGVLKALGYQYKIVTKRAS